VHPSSTGTPGRKAIKWGMVRNIAISWVVTVTLAGLVSAGGPSFAVACYRTTLLAHFLVCWQYSQSLVV
jgi:hypothetical protein